MPYTQQWQLPDGTPDWSIAPADATMYMPESDIAYESFLKEEDGKLYFINRVFGTERWNEDAVEPDKADHSTTVYRT